MTAPHPISPHSISLQPRQTAYFSQYESLKAEENFSEIVRLGELALLDVSLNKEQQAKIHAQLASSSFYLGDYDSCKSHAESCLALSEFLSDSSFLLRALYLLSAYYRAEGNQALEVDEPLSNQSFHEGREIITKALHYIEGTSCEFTQAKVYFNAAALESDDPGGNKNQAIIWYQKACTIFLKQGRYDDYARSAIRLGKVFLTLKRHEELSELLLSLKNAELPQKTQVHLLYLKAQFEVQKGEIAQAKESLLKGIDLASGLHMKVDLERLSHLLNHL